VVGGLMVWDLGSEEEGLECDERAGGDGEDVLCARGCDEGFEVGDFGSEDGGGEGWVVRSGVGRGADLEGWAWGCRGGFGLLVCCNV
jgi:hypothetical protein